MANLTADEVMRIGEIMKREFATTPGPWKVRTHPELKSFVEAKPKENMEKYGYGIGILQEDDNEDVYPRREADVEFVANAKQDIPFLLELIARAIITPGNDVD
jgi:hypothetical protein